MELKLSRGPWEKLFSGNFQDQELDIYLSAENMILVVIYEKEGGNKVGAVIEIYKVFASVGELEGFVETLPKEVVVLSKHSEKETIKYLLLASKPSYVSLEEDEFTREVDVLLKELDESSKMLKDVSKAYDLKLQELDEASEKVKTTFLNQPLVIAAVSTVKHPLPKAEEVELVKMLGNEVLLGLNKKKEKIVEPLNLFMNTLVIGGSQNDRKHALHVLIEATLLSNIPAVVLDWEKEFEGLAQASKELKELNKYKVEGEPMGFPCKHFYLKDQLMVDLNTMNGKGFAEVFGFNGAELAQVLEQAFKKGGIENMAGLIERIKSLKPTEKFTAYKKHRLARIAALVEDIYPRLFGGENDIEEITKTQPRALGRAGIMHLEGVDARATLLVFHSIVKGLVEFYRKQGRAKALKAIVFIPHAKKLIEREHAGILSTEIADSLLELTNYGVGFAVSEEREIDIAEQVVTAAEARINIITKNDVGVKLKGKKSYRVFLRPGLSACTEK